MRQVVGHATQQISTPRPSPHPPYKQKPRQPLAGQTGRDATEPSTVRTENRPSLTRYRSGKMLNMMWTGREDVCVKQEPDTASNPGSPYHSSSLGNPPSSPYNTTSVPDFHRLTPPDAPGYFYPEPADSPQLQTLVPLQLPSFQTIPPGSPRRTPEFIPISMSDFTSSQLHPMSHSPDSSQHNSISPSEQSPDTQEGLRGRKRSNSGSSGSSANSASCGVSRAKARRRQPISQDELMHQRNQGQSCRNSNLSL